MVTLASDGANPPFYNPLADTEVSAALISKIQYKYTTFSQRK